MSDQRRRTTTRHRQPDPANATGDDDGMSQARAEADRRLRSIDSALERARRVDAHEFLLQSRQTGGQ